MAIVQKVKTLEKIVLVAWILYCVGAVLLIIGFSTSSWGTGRRVGGIRFRGWFLRYGLWTHTHSQLTDASADAFIAVRVMVCVGFILTMLGLLVLILLCFDVSAISSVIKFIGLIPAIGCLLIVVGLIVFIAPENEYLVGPGVIAGYSYGCTWAGTVMILVAAVLFHCSAKGGKAIVIK